MVVKDGLIQRSWGYFNPYSYSYFNIKKFLSEEIPFSCNISSHVGIKKILSYIYNPLQISNWIPSRSKVARSKIIKYQIHSIIIKNKIKYKLLIINIYIKKNHRYVSKSLNSMKNLQRYIYNDIKRTFLHSLNHVTKKKQFDRIAIRGNRDIPFTSLPWFLGYYGEARASWVVQFFPWKYGNPLDFRNNIISLFYLNHYYVRQNTRVGQSGGRGVGDENRKKGREEYTWCNVVPGGCAE